MIPKTASEMISFFGWSKHTALNLWAARPTAERSYPCPIGSRTQRDVANLGHAVEAGLPLDAIRWSAAISLLGDAETLRNHANLLRMCCQQQIEAGPEEQGRFSNVTDFGGG